MHITPPHNAILQRDGVTYAIVPRIPGGLLNHQQMRSIAEVVEKYNIPLVKITSGQRLVLVGLKEEDLAAVYQDLGIPPGKATELCLHYVQACPGTEVCKFGVGDSLGFAIHLEQLLSDREFPAKLKIGISGCQFCCSESLVRDIGVIAKKNGWTVSFGGHSGNRPRVGNIVAENLSDTDAINLINKFLDYYKLDGKKKERTSRFIERVGIDAVMQSIA